MIIYAVISRASDGQALVESSSSSLSGNVPQVTGLLLDTLKSNPDHVPNGTRKTFVHRNDEEQAFCGAMDDWNPFKSFAVNADPSPPVSSDLDYFFHVLHVDLVFYVCLSDDSQARKQAINFSFLDQVHQEFSSQYASHKIKRANAYSMEKSFSPQLRSIMHHYNTNHSSMGRDQNVEALHAQVDDLKAVMGRNINIMLNRGEKLDDMVEQSEMLMDEANVFKKTSKDLKNTVWWQNQKYILLIGSCVLALIYLLAANACGITMSRCRKSR